MPRIIPIKSGVLPTKSHQPTGVFDALRSAVLFLHFAETFLLSSFGFHLRHEVLEGHVLGGCDGGYISYIYICVCVCVYMYIYIYSTIELLPYADICIYICVCICTWMIYLDIYSILLYICVYVRMWLYTYNLHICNNIVITIYTTMYSIWLYTHMIRIAMMESSSQAGMEL